MTIESGTPPNLYSTTEMTQDNTTDASRIAIGLVIMIDESRVCKEISAWNCDTSGGADSVAVTGPKNGPKPHVVLWE